MRSGLEIADVFRDGHSSFVAQYGHRLRPGYRQRIASLPVCRKPNTCGLDSSKDM
jgi:hypothetical protein